MLRLSPEDSVEINSFINSIKGVKILLGLNGGKSDIFEKIKGVKGIYEQLEQEAEDSFRERKQQAKKLGEEASTKLLVPMILMLGIVMAIVIVPAFLKFFLLWNPSRSIYKQ